MKNVVIYTRVSSDDQANNTSLGDQKEKLEKYCENKGYKIIRHFQDDFSAKTFDRPAIKEFLNFAKANKGTIDYFLVIRWDRFSRNVRDSYNMIDTLLKMGIEVRAIEQPIDMTIVENRILLGIYLTVPEVENIRRGKNTFNGIRAAKKAGRFCSTAPFGYQYTKEGAKKPYLVANEEKSHLVKKAFELYSTGLYAKEEIRRLLAKEGLKLGKNAFSLIFHNPLYCGNVLIEAYEDEPETVIQGIHEPIITEELYNQVQFAHKNKNKIYPKKYTSKEELPLRGFLQCPECGRNWTGSASKGNSGKVFYYHCQSPCKARVRADKANDAFIEWLKDISIKPEHVESFLEIFSTVYKEEQGDRKSQLARVNTQIKVVEEKILNANMMFVEREIDKDSYQSVKEAYNDELLKLKNQKIELQSLDKDFISQIEKAFNLISNLSDFYAKSSLESKKKLLGSILTKRLVLENNQYRTIGENEILDLIFLINSDIEKLKEDKRGKFPNLSSVVARIGLISNQIGL